MSYAENEPVPEQVAQFSQEVYQMDLMPALLAVLPRLEFEVGWVTDAVSQRYRADICGPAAA